MPRVEGGLLGADIRPDASGAFRVEKIYPGENWHENFRNHPLTEPGVRVKKGITSSPSMAYRPRAWTTSTGCSKRRAQAPSRCSSTTARSATGARTERVRPITSEQGLRYLDWVESRRRIVDKASNGRIGYIHLPNTGEEGNRELFKSFYPQAAKEALIIDVRYNGGGFIPDRMIELVSRPVLNYWARRGVEPTSTPAYANSGPKVCLINGQSSSGGDAFPYYFRKLGLGPLIGTRTWGGLIGISGNPPLLDGGRSPRRRSGSSAREASGRSRGWASRPTSR